MSTPSTSPLPKTVAELIVMLRAMPPDALVSTEGCDCVGPWSGEIELSPESNVVVIGRSDGRDDADEWMFCSPTPMLNVPKARQARSEALVESDLQAIEDEGRKVTP